MNTKELFETYSLKNTEEDLKISYWTQSQYEDALNWITTHKSLDVKEIWGRQWRYNLSTALPFILKLIQYGYNDYTVQRISSCKTKWYSYSEKIALCLLSRNNIPESVYYEGISYKALKTDGSFKQWNTLNPFQVRVTEQAESKVLQRSIKNLIEIGAMAKVSGAIISAVESFSSSYIIDKQRLRELISLFLSSFYSINHTSLCITSYSSSQSNQTINKSYLPSLEDKLGGIAELIDWNNSILPEQEQLTFKGRRAWAEVNNLYNEKKHIDEDGNCLLPEGAMTIQKYADEIFGNGNWEEFDRRGSIYNLTRTLNGNGYLDNDVDIYVLMNGRPFGSEEERDIFKKTQMRVYFSNAHKFRAVFTRVYNDIIEKNKPNDKSENWKLVYDYWNLLGCPDTDWSTFVNNAVADYKRRKKNMKKIIGDNSYFIDKKGRRTPLDERNPNHIFVHETEAYLPFVTKLRKMGIRVIQVYDGFFYPKDCGLSKTDLDNMLKEIVLNYYNESFLANQEKTTN